MSPGIDRSDPRPAGSARERIAAGDSRAALLAAARLTQSGRDALGFVGDLEAHARDLLIVQTLGTVPPELQITPDRDERLAEQAGRIGTGAVARLLDLLAAALEATKNGSDARTQLELALVKAAAPAIDPSTQALLARIERLEAALRGVAPALPQAPAAPAAPALPAANRADAPAVAAAAQAAARAEAAAPPRRPLTDPGPQPPEPEQDPGVQALAPPAPPADRDPEPPPAPEPPANAEPQAPPSPEPPANGAPDPSATAHPSALELESLRAVWPAVLDSLKSSGNTLCAHMLADTRPVAVEGAQVTVAFAPDEHAEHYMRKADDDDHRASVAEAIRAITGDKPQVAYVLGEDAAVAEEPAAPPTDSEWVDRFVAEFDAEEIHPESEAS